MGALSAVPASAEDLRVPAQYLTIQAAVDAAKPGDRILVSKGEYAGATVTKAVEIRGMGDAKIVSGPMHPNGRLTFGFLIGEFASGAGGDGVTIAELTFTEAVTLPIYSRGANDVTISHNTFLNTYQGITNRGGSRWNITYNTFQDLRADNGGGLAIMIGDQSGRDVQGNFVAHNRISGTLHVPVRDGGNYDGAGITLFADFRYGQNGAKSIAFNRVVKNSVALVSDNPGLVDVKAFELSVGVDEGADPGEQVAVIHENVIAFNDFRGTDKPVQLTPALLGASNSLLFNFGDNGRGDFDGDGKADVSVFRPLHRTWSIANSGTGPKDVQYGGQDDMSVNGDFNGDGKTEIATYRLSEGKWFVDGVVDGFAWGTKGDVPVPGDYDGDGKTDYAVFRPSNGFWFIKNSSTDAGTYQWGIQGDVPVPGDYDGDGKTDLAIFRPSEHQWYIAYSSTGFNVVDAFLWGADDDALVPADYDGDGKTDIAIYRPSEGRWYVMYSSTGPNVVDYGLRDEDVPVPADYDGDGKTDFATFRPSEGKWYIKQSSNGMERATTTPDLVK